MNKMSGNYARYMFGNSQTNILTYKLDMRLYYELTHFMDNNSTIKQCVGILDRFLFQSVEINGAKKLMNQYLDKYFLPFFRRMLRNIITLGWCPYHTKKIKDPKTGMPIVVPEVFPVEYIKCQMLVNRETLDYEFQFLNYEGDRIRKDIKVFVFSDMSLIANGALIHSLLSGLLPEQRYSNQIKKFTIQSEYVRSNPPVYLKVDHAAAGQRSTTNQTNGFAGGNQNNQRQVGAQNVPNPANFQQRAVVQVPEMLEKASTDMIKNVEFHQQEVHNLAMMQDNNYYNMGLGFAPQWYNNLFICPPNMTLAANPHLPESRVDQIVIERKLASDIYLSFGIPETLLGLVGGSQNSIRNSTGRSSNIRKDVNIMDVNSFESTLFRYQNFFQDCFVVLFDVIFNKEVDKNIVEFKPPKLYEQFIANVLAENEISVKGKEEKSTTERSKTLGGDADKSPKKEESSGDTSKMKDSNGKKAESEEGNKGSSSSKSSNDKVDTEKVVNKGPKSKDSKDGDKEKESKDDSKAKTKDDNKDKESKDDSKAKTKDENKDKESKDDSKAKTKDDNKDKESKDDKKEKPKDDSKDKESKDDDKKEKSTDKESKEKDSKSDDESDKESKKRKPEDSDEDDSDSDSEDDKPKRHRKSKRQRKK
jgi:hypothetical protein